MRIGGLAVATWMVLAVAPCFADTSKDTQPQQIDFSKQRVLYLVGYAHLDTQWRWSYPQVIAEFLRKTMEDNFRLFDKYPHYIFNFTGANRYMMMKEYYPKDFQRLKDYVAKGRWFAAGSSMEEGDANMPSGEALIRQVLYGNEFFRKEFGEASNEFMLPDCFGFQASLPSILAHCGIQGFSTQKLTWGSAVGIPFNVGVWIGPDGRGVVAALNPLSYTSTVDDDLSSDPMWILRLGADYLQCGVGVDYHYYGTGDRGGAPDEDSVKWVEKSVTSNGPVKVISSRADQMFVDLTKDQIAKLPTYRGDLLLTNHSAGSLSSEAFVKRLNRKSEQLASAAEAASVMADWLGSAPYPREKLANAWRLVLGAHFHDTMAGTMIPKAYEYTWNNMVLDLNQFAAIAQDAAGGVIKGMETQGEVPIVVYNPLSIEREDVAEATVDYPSGLLNEVLGPDGKPVPSQFESLSANRMRVLFLAKAPPMGFASYDVFLSQAPLPMDGKVSAGSNYLENLRFRVTLNFDGDVASIFDKKNNREALRSPMRLAFLHENPAQYPAWNMDWNDRKKPPVGYVQGPAEIQVIEQGPVQGALQITRYARGSKFVQIVRLAAGGAGDHIEIETHVDWQTQQSSLKAVFPLTVSNPNAVYESQTAAVVRGNNDAKKFEVPQQQWLDLDAADGSYGVGILNDCKYGSDKPDDGTVRLTLLYTPEADRAFQDQGTQDLGRHEMVYAVAPHEGTWQEGNVPWVAARVNQRLIAFQCPAHNGVLGTQFSMLRCSSDAVRVIAMKKAEEGNRIIVRVNEIKGSDVHDARLEFAAPVVAADDMDGQERKIGDARVEDGQIVFDIQPFGLRTFSVQLADPSQRLSPPVTQEIPLDWNLDAVSFHENLSDGAFDEKGKTYPGEGLPARIVSEGIPFTLGSTADGQKNALACDGQTIWIADGFAKLYLLASALNGDQTGEFEINGKPVSLKVQDWGGYIGQWDNRLWRGVIPALTYNWNNKFAGLLPGYIKRDTVAWFSSYRHDPDVGNEYYRFCYLFKYALDLPAGVKTVVLPKNPKIRIFAMTAGSDVHDDVTAGEPLYDTLEDHAENGAPVISPGGGKYSAATWITIAHPLYWHDGGLHYTIDGTEPTVNSPVYSGAFVATQNVKVRAREFDSSGKGGPIAGADLEIDDTTRPQITGVSALSILPEATISFSEPLNRTAAESLENYRFDPSATAVSASLSADGMSVKLRFAEPLKAGKYHLTMTGVTDISPAANPVESDPVIFDVSQPVYSAAALNLPQDARNEAVKGLPVGAGDAWTLNMFVRSARMPDDHTIIAGFGKCDDAEDGTGRYLTVYGRHVHFWSRVRDVDTDSNFNVGRWQMLTATYDGHEAVVYKNGREIGRGEVELADDEARVWIAPIDPWDRQRTFAGEVRDMTIWNSALPGDEVAEMFTASPK
jgi:alpha-mannosidase